MSSPARDWLGWLLLIGILLVVAGILLPLNPIADGDPAFYGMIARNILSSGDWLTLHHRLMPLIDKPPLTFWIMSLSFAALGTAEWVLHLWHTVLALALVSATYALARLALPRRQAVLSTLVLVVSVEFFYESLVPRQDIPLTLFVTLAVYGYLRWEHQGRLSSLLLSWLAAALAVLTKGIIGLALPALIVALHLVIDRPRLPRFALSAAGAGAVVFLAVAIPWFLTGAVRQGHLFIDAFFLNGALGVGRYFHPVLGAPTRVPSWAGFGAYVPLLLFGALPWTGWIWPALREGWAARRERSSVVWVCVLWVVAVFGFHSLSLGDKTMRYLLPLFPPLAVLVGRVVEDDRFTRQSARVSLVAVAVLLIVAAGLLVVQLPRPTERYLSYASYATYAPLFLAFLAALIMGLVGYAVAAMAGRPRTGVACLVLATLLAHGLVITWIARTWDQISPWRPLARVINHLQAPGARVLIVTEHTDLADYYIDRPVEFVNRNVLVRVWPHGRVLAIIPETAVGGLPSPRPVVLSATRGLVLVSNFPIRSQPQR